MHLCSWIFPSQPYLLAISRSWCPLTCCPKSRLHHSLARSHIDSSVISARSVKIALSLSEHRRIPCITCGKRLTSSYNLWWSELKLLGFSAFFIEQAQGPSHRLTPSCSTIPSSRLLQFRNPAFSLSEHRTISLCIACCQQLTRSARSRTWS